MKRIFFALAVLGSAGLAFAPHASVAQQYGPGDKGATLKQPWLDAAPPASTSPSPTPSYLQGLLNSSGAAAATPTVNSASSLQPYDTTGINNDILVTPELGPWLILVTSYGGPEGPVRARQMVSVLRAQFKLPAYVFNFGAEEKRKELARVAKLIDEQKAKLKQELKEHNLPDDLSQPVRVRYERIEEYCGVLVGGYPTVDAATAARDKLRKLDIVPNMFTLKTPGDLLDMKYYVGNDPKTKAKGQAESVFVHPFVRALPVPNPTTKTEKAVEKLDIAKLKYMNSAEEFSVFKCNKPYTLAIKRFDLPARTASRADTGPSSIIGGWGLGKKTQNNEDFAAENAHNFAEALRKSKLDAYVLHMKYYSVVTVGGFTSADDPQLRSMQNLLDTRLLPELKTVQVFPKAVVMEIPH